MNTQEDDAGDDAKQVPNRLNASKEHSKPSQKPTHDNEKTIDTTDVKSQLLWRHVFRITGSGSEALIDRRGRGGA